MLSRFAGCLSIHIHIDIHYADLGQASLIMMQQRVGPRANRWDLIQGVCFTVAASDASSAHKCVQVCASVMGTLKEGGGQCWTSARLMAATLL